MNESPLAQASYLLARAFGWTPQQVQALTMAQVSIYLRLLEQEAALLQGDEFSST
ncbi:MAG: hypothetical protein L6R45_16970 [Anaerolineae bacterium]|nr:hypothetical protein [Anaerolineae bacterium]